HQPRGRFTQNQFGGTLGGPLIKNKTFVFGDFARFSDRQSTTVTSTVPTPLMKTGNFTELPYSLSDSSVTGQAGCVAGNIIQATSTTNQPCSDPVAAKLMTLLPDPNVASLMALQGTPGSWTKAPNYLLRRRCPTTSIHLMGVLITRS